MNESAGFNTPINVIEALDTLVLQEKPGQIKEIATFFVNPV